VFRLHGDEPMRLDGLKNCSHVLTVRPQALELDLTRLTCRNCSERKDLNICLCCYQVFCSRDANGHSYAHYKETGHYISMCLIDLSFWCYACHFFLEPDFYKILKPIYNDVYKLKFDELPPNPWPTAKSPIKRQLSGVDEGLLDFPELFRSGSTSSTLLGITNKKQKTNEDTLSLLLGDDLLYQTDILPFPVIPEARPLKPCTHIKNIHDISKKKPKNISDMCDTCQIGGDSWLCLHKDCLKVLCGRFMNKHMLMHGKETGHSVCMSLLDFSVWCESCERYIPVDQPEIKAIYEHFHFERFAEMPF